jgi:hypothetical protein
VRVRVTTLWHGLLSNVSPYVFYLLRLERTALIESSSVVEKLLRSVTKSGDPVIQSIALDILIWIAVIRLGRLRNSQDNSQEQQFTFLKLVESQLGDFLHTCFIQGK